MDFYPILELQNGKPVSLNRGRLSQATVWNLDPVQVAKTYARQGANWLHVKDLDPVAGDGDNGVLIEEIILYAGLQVQVAGGIRTMEQIENWIARGAARVVLGTIGVLQPNLVHQAAKRFPDQIVLAVDVYQGRVVSHGWSTPSTFEPADFLRHFASDPLAAVMVADIDADLNEAENSMALISRLGGIVSAPMVARGLSNSADNLSRLKYVPHVDGAAAGQPLLDKSLDLADALAMCAEPAEKLAAFT